MLTTITATATETITQPVTEDDIIRQLQALELEVTTSYTLADAMREGSKVTTQEYGWGRGDTACSLSAARLAARARGYIS
jgi:hypothetical protein